MTQKAYLFLVFSVLSLCPASAQLNLFGLLNPLGCQCQYNAMRYCCYGGYYGGSNPYYAQNSYYGAIRPMNGYSYPGPYTNPVDPNWAYSSYNSALTGYGASPYSPLRCRDRSAECVGMAQTGQCAVNPQARAMCPQSCAVPECLDGMGMGGFGTMDQLGYGYGAPGGALGSMYPASFYPGPPGIIPPASLATPGYIGAIRDPTAFPFNDYALGMNDLAMLNGGVGPLGRPMSIYDQDSIYNSAYGTVPLRAQKKPTGRHIHSGQTNMSSSNIVAYDLPTTPPPDPFKSSGQRSNVLSLDELIKRMDTNPFSS